MSINLQQLLVALVMLVPGFIVTRIQRAFRPRRFSSQFEWFVSSILHGIVLNAVLVIALLWFVPGYRAITLIEASVRLKQLAIPDVALYLAVLYLVAGIWGAISGMFSFLELRALANRFGLTRYAEHSSVWARIFDVQVPDDRKTTWLRFDGGNSEQFFGRLRHSSEIVEQDKPIEVYFAPLYRLVGDQWQPVILSGTPEKCDGCYMRLTHENSIQFFFRDSEWNVPHNT